MPPQNRNPAGSAFERGFPGIREAALFAAVICAYIPALRSGFVWNDADYVTRPALRSLEGLARIWFHPGATEQYYPILHSAFWIEHRIWGDSPFGYHLFTVLLHASAACLFAAVLRQLKVPGAYLAALVFALHPVCVESVAWIAEQKNTLSLVFYLMAAMAYLAYEAKRGDRCGKAAGSTTRLTGEGRVAPPRSAKGWAYTLALVFFILAILSKSVTATLPAALLVVTWWKRGRISLKGDVLPLLPFLVLGASIGLFTAWVEKTSIGANGPEFDLSAAQRCLIAGRALWFYLGKLAWPSPLIFMYPRWNVDPAALRQWVFPLAALAVLALLWLQRGRFRAPLAIALLFAGSLFPTLGFFNVYAFVFSFVADHFQYVACLSLIAGAAAAWQSLPRIASTTAGRIAAVAVIAALGILTWRQCRHYSDETTLYRSILSENPDSWLGNYNLANALRESGRPREAIPLYETVLRTHPSHSGAENNLGLALVDCGQSESAIVHYRQALRLRPGYAAAENNLGTAEWALGRRNEAIDAYRAALRLDPAYPEAWYNLGLSLSATGRLEEAVASFAKAVEFRPDFPEAARALAGARNNFGIALYSSGQVAAAVEQFEKALALDTSVVETHLNIAIALRKLGRIQEAAEHDKTAKNLRSQTP